MNRPLSATVLALATFAVASPAHAAGYVRCGDDGNSYNGSAGAYDIFAKRTPCTEARWLGRRWFDRSDGADELPTRVGHFHCRATQPHRSGEPYIGKVLCTRNGGRQAVRFAVT